MFGQQNNTKPIVFFLVFLGIVAAVIYWRVGVEEAPGDYHVKKGNYRLEDGQYGEALQEFREALKRNPDHVGAHLGLAISYMQMQQAEKALAEFDRTLALDPSLAVAHADKGILLDRLGRYEEALASYRKALELDAEVLAGPGWLWRFMRNIDRPPPTVRERAAYLEAEFKKPPAERLLRVPEEDAKQRMYPAD